MMMALTPKRLFLSLCISISLLRSYTFFSRSPLVSKTLFESVASTSFLQTVIDSLSQRLHLGVDALDVLQNAIVTRLQTYWCPRYLYHLVQSATQTTRVQSRETFGSVKCVSFVKVSENDFSVIGDPFHISLAKVLEVPWPWTKVPGRFFLHVSLHMSTSAWLKQDPLEAILVIFGRRALIFFVFVWKLLEKMKNNTTFVRMCSGDHLGDAKMSKKGTSLLRI